MKRWGRLRSGPWLASAFALTLAGCGANPVVTLGGDSDAAADEDEDLLIDEAERERVFRDLAQRECNQDEPVCGADGQTYRNYCQAVAFGIEVTRPGPC